MPLGPAWLRSYGFGLARADLIAGLTLAAYLIPAAIGDASLARLSPENGLYACLCAGLVWWLFSSSRHTAITVTSAISLLLGTTLGSLAEGDASRFGALAAGTALMVALLAFVAWLVGAGALVSFVSESVMVGFKTGVALTLASTQIPKLLGIAGAHGGFWECASHTARLLHETSAMSLAVGVAALLLLIAGKRFLPLVPMALVVVIAGVAVSTAAGLDQFGVRMLGDVPQGLPSLGVPAIRWADLNDILPLAMACFLLAAVETTAIGRMLAARHGGRVDPNREFLALAAANLAAGAGQGLPVSGGISQSLVNEGAGARTPLSGLVAALAILVVAVYFSGLLRELPQPVLAAIVLMAVPGLVSVSALRRLWTLDRQEFVVAAAALAGVLTSGLLRGALIGAAISLLLVIRRAARPHVAFLGRIPGTRRFSDLERHGDNERIPGILVFRPEGSLLYFNAEHVRDVVQAAVRDAIPRPGDVVCDLSAAPRVDFAGAEMLMALEADLRAIGARLHVVEAHASVRDRLRLEGIEDRTEPIERFTSVADAVDRIQRGRGAGAQGGPDAGRA